MYAYVIIHFGSGIKYLEYEIYSILMLKSISKYDVVYMYSKNDTPKIFVEIIKKMDVKVKEFDDSIIINKLKNYHSVYERYNILRTCCFIYANILMEYEKICIVESDMILYKDFNNIFENKTPAAFIVKECNRLKNDCVPMDKNEILKICKKYSPLNAGVFLIKPDINLLKNLDKKLNIIIENECVSANEVLFMLLYKKIFNLPIKYNLGKIASILKINVANIKSYGYHFDSSEYKPIDIIKDNYINKIKRKHMIKPLLYFKTKFYDKYNEQITKIINQIQV